MYTLINRIFGRIEKGLSRNHIRLFKTIYVNFRLLKFRNAIKFPIYIYGNTSLYCLNGRVEFVNTPVCPGMIKLGKLNNQYSNNKCSSLLLSNNSTIQFSGRFVAAKGYLLHIKDNAKLTIGKYVSIGDNVSIICSNTIVIGNYTQITFNTYVVDTNFHFTIDLDKKAIKRREGSVHIGERNWIGNSCYITKGTHTGNGCVIGVGSFLNKSFIGIDNVLIVGRPANIKRYNYTRVLSYERENEIEQLFSKTNQEMINYNGNYIDPYEDVSLFFD